MRRIKSYKNFRDSLNEGLFDSIFGGGKKSPLVEELVNTRMFLENDNDFTFYEKSYLLNLLQPQLKEIVKKLIKNHLEKTKPEESDVDSLDLDLPPGVTMAQDEEDVDDEPFEVLDDVLDKGFSEIPFDSLRQLYDLALGSIMEHAEKLAKGESFVIYKSQNNNDFDMLPYSDTEEGFRSAKKHLIHHLEGVMKLAENDEQYRLCSKIKKYIDLINQV